MTTISRSTTAPPGHPAAAMTTGTTTRAAVTAIARIPASPVARRDATIAPAAAARDDFRHSYSKDQATLVRRLSRIEGQVRGIARMIEREEYCVDILQQTAALRAAVDSVSIMILEDHVRGCVRTAAEQGASEQYVDEVIDVVRRAIGRPVRPARGS